MKPSPPSIIHKRCVFTSQLIPLLSLPEPHLSRFFTFNSPINQEYENPITHPSSTTRAVIFGTLRLGTVVPHTWTMMDGWMEDLRLPYSVAYSSERRY